AAQHLIQSLVRARHVADADAGANPRLRRRGRRDGDEARNTAKREAHGTRTVTLTIGDPRHTKDTLRRDLLALQVVLSGKRRPPSPHVAQEDTMTKALQLAALLVLAGTVSAAGQRPAHPPARTTPGKR